MMKVLKEFAIYILIIALIVLVFGILFYKQLPSNKLIPIASEYALPENLENVLEGTLSDKENKEVLVTYTVEQTDLDKYKENAQYDPGKIDPFADYGAEVEENNSIANNGNNNTIDNKKNNTSNAKNNNITNNNTTKTGNNNVSNTNNTTGGKLTETKPGK